MDDERTADGSGLGVLSCDYESVAVLAWRFILNTEESKNQIGTLYHSEHRRTQAPDRHSVSF